MVPGTSQQVTRLSAVRYSRMNYFVRAKMLIRLPRTVRDCGPDENGQPVHDGSSSAPVLSPPSQTDSATTKAPPEPPFLSIREAADWLCVSLSTLKRLIAKGELSVVRVGKRRKVPASYLAAYVGKDILLPDESIDVG